MTNDAHPADGEALSVDQAAELLGGAGAHDEEPREDEAQARSGEPDEEVEAQDDDLDIEDETGAIKPPHSWDAEARAIFATLPTEAQVVIAGREAERDRAVSLAQQDAAEARRSAQEAGEAAPFIGEAVERAAQLFQRQYGEVDWLSWAVQDPEGCMAARQEFEQEAAHIQQMDAARHTAETLRHRHFLAQEQARLPREAPDLADPKRGPALKAQLGQFLLAQGFEMDRLAHASATDLALAYDAMRWREAQAGLSSRPERETRGETRTVRPTAAQAPRSSQARRASDALAKLSRSGSVDDAVAYLRTRG